MLAFDDNGTYQLKVIRLSDGTELTVGENMTSNGAENLPVWVDAEHIVYIRSVPNTKNEFVTDLVIYGIFLFRLMENGWLILLMMATLD